MGNGGEHVRIQLWAVRPIHFSTLVSMVWLALLLDKDPCAGKFQALTAYSQFIHSWKGILWRESLEN